MRQGSNKSRVSSRSRLSVRSDDRAETIVHSRRRSALTRGVITRSLDIGGGRGPAVPAVRARCRSKKVDGVLSVECGVVNVVVEVTDSKCPARSEYLHEAERNRTALASLGLVRIAEQLGGHTIGCSALGGSSWPSSPTRTTPPCCGPSCRCCGWPLWRRIPGRIPLRSRRRAKSSPRQSICSAGSTRSSGSPVGQRQRGQIDKEADVLRGGLDRLLGQAVTALAGAAESVAAAA